MFLPKQFIEGHVSFSIIGHISFFFFSLVLSAWSDTNLVQLACHLIDAALNCAKFMFYLQNFFSNEQCTKLKMVWDKYIRLMEDYEV